MIASLLPRLTVTRNIPTIATTTTLRLRRRSHTLPTNSSSISARIPFRHPSISRVQRGNSTTTTTAFVPPPPPEYVISNTKQLTMETLCPRLRNMEYAVRGKVVIAADVIQSELLKQKQQPQQNDNNKYPFDHIVYTNVGNPHSVGQQPLTWPRQTLALVDLPDNVGVDHPLATQIFPPDAIERAKKIKRGLGGMGTGAYSHSQGAKCFRDDVAAFIQERDGGVPCHPNDLFLTNGASAAIRMILQALVTDSTCGVMIPIPQYPIYSSSLTLLGGQGIGYYLDESKGWDLNFAEVERSFLQARDRGVRVVAMVVINPGNPTGQVLSQSTLQEICNFCAEHKLVLLADEVYQENVYDDNTKFISCKRAAFEDGLLEKNAIELVSFHSTSKGLFGECGRRGGYMELVGIDPQVKDQLYKLASSSLCSSLSGQVMVSLMAQGPKPGDDSFVSHEAEKATIFQSLKRKSQLVSQGLDAIPGFSCQPAQGAMYCFPRIDIPPKAIAAAKDTSLPPDTLYSISLLERTGICVVPASGFGQAEGRYGFRTTFLPHEEELKRVVDLIGQHHEEFCAKYQ